MYSVEDKVVQLEQRHNISCRWQACDESYRIHWHSLERRRRRQLIDEMYTLANERQFFLIVKRKHGG